ncbi:MAG: hypothetical protein WCV92_01095 [Candidatus Buchananbacteria bacterium]
MKTLAITATCILCSLTASAADLRVYKTVDGIVVLVNLEGTNPADLTNTPGLIVADITGFGLQINEVPDPVWQLFLEQLGVIPASGWISFRLTSDQIDVASLTASKFTPYFTTAGGRVFFDTSFSGLTSSLNNQPLSAISGDGNYPFNPASQGNVISPVITAAPGNLTVAEGGFVQFSVTASSAVPSGGITYQWFRNDSPIPGARDAEFIIQSAIAVDAGNYSVVVTDPIGTVTLNASLTVGDTQAMPSATPIGLALLVMAIIAMATGGQRVLRTTKR